MFIRFKKRMTTSKKWEKHYQRVKTDESIGTGPYGTPMYKYRDVPLERYTLSVQLVESKRVNGKPRQWVIAFLGSVKSEDLARPSPYVWGRAYKTFATLGLAGDVQERLLQQIANRLPRVSVEDVEKAEREA
jgi:hypothetical protein